MHGWHGMTHRARLEPQVRCMNACTTTHLNAAHRAQWCAVVTSVWVKAFMQLFAMRSRLFKLCVRMYAVCRSHLCIVKCSWIWGAGYIPFTDNGHFSVLVQRKCRILSVHIVHKVNGTKWQRRWCWHSQKADTQSSVPRVHCAEVSSKTKAVENCRYTIEPIWKRSRLSHIFPVIELSLYGAVAELCEEYETSHDRTRKPVVGGQSSSSFVPCVIKTDVPLESDRANKDLLSQRYGERIEKLSEQDKLSKFCMVAGFLNVVEIGQYFMTKDTAEL